MNMYKEVPEQFHKRLLETLNDLEEREEGKTIEVACSPQKKKVFYGRRAVAAAAAMLLLFGGITAGAAELFKWQERARQRFGVSSGLENELTFDGVTVGESAAAYRDGLTLQALQSLRTINSYYILLKVTLPEGIPVDENTGFEEAIVESGKEFYGIVADIVADSIEGNQFLCEVSVLTRDGVDYTGEQITLKLRNLIQTEKAVTVGEPLVAGEWALPLILTAQPGTKDYYVNQTYVLGSHGLTVDKVQAGPFGLRIYVDSEEARHALKYYRVSLTGIEYENGTVVAQDQAFKAFSSDEDGACYYSFSFEGGNAVDVDRIAALLIGDGEARVSLRGEMDETVSAQPAATALPWTVQSGVETLYNRDGYAAVTDGNTLWIWDTVCGREEASLDLTALGYDPKQGEILFGPGGSIAYISPRSGSETLYMYLLETDGTGEREVLTQSADILTEENRENYRGFQKEVLDIFESNQ